MSAPVKTKRTRLSAEERKEQIIAAAIKLFAEHGFDSSTHQLAQSLGVTQPLIYRHFPTKDDLVSAVYERVFLSEWRASWDILLSNRDIVLKQRLAEFYSAYTKKIFDPEWIRIYLFSGLKRLEINRWYVALVEERVLGRLAIELRHHHGLPDTDTAPVTPDEIEALWLLHGGIFYYGVRDGVYGLSPKVGKPAIIEIHAGMVVDSMRSVMIAATKRPSKV